MNRNILLYKTRKMCGSISRSTVLFLQVVTLTAGLGILAATMIVGVYLTQEFGKAHKEFLILVYFFGPLLVAFLCGCISKIISHSVRAFDDTESKICR